jgi:hypothetical protein
VAIRRITESIFSVNSTLTKGSELIPDTNYDETFYLDPHPHPLPNTANFIHSGSILVKMKIYLKFD